MYAKIKIIIKKNTHWKFASLKLIDSIEALSIFKKLFLLKNFTAFSKEHIK